jgi:serine/threonine-protein kinase
VDPEQEQEQNGERERVPQTIAGRWQVEKLLGRGGMGTVYKARHVLTGVSAAVKVIPILEEGVGQRERALKAAAVSALQSPHTVRLLDVGEESKFVFLVHELVEGQSLRELIPLNLRDALVVALGVSDALADAHRNGFIHRDIKPTNVIVPWRADGSLDFTSSKLLDFGVAGFLEPDGRGASRTGAGQLFGTPLYMSPEQARGEPQTVAWERYSTRWSLVDRRSRPTT